MRELERAQQFVRSALRWGRTARPFPMRRRAGFARAFADVASLLAELDAALIHGDTSYKEGGDDYLRRHNL